MNPNHYLAVAIQYLFGGGRPGWPSTAQIGKTLVSSSMIDRVAAALGKPMVEVPVGFKWFVPGLIDGSFGFGGEESAGASFLRTRRHDVDHRQGRDHPRPARLRDPGEDRADARASTTPTWSPQHGDPAYARIDAPATREQKAKLARALARRRHRHRAGRRADHRQAHRGARQRRQDRRPQGDHRVARGSRPARRGTEDVYKIYAESFQGPRAPRRGAGGRPRGGLGGTGLTKAGHTSTFSRMSTTSPMSMPSRQRTSSRSGTM